MAPSSTVRAIGTRDAHVRPWASAPGAPQAIDAVNAVSTIRAIGTKDALVTLGTCQANGACRPNRTGRVPCTRWKPLLHVIGLVDIGHSACRCRARRTRRLDRRPTRQSVRRQHLCRLRLPWRTIERTLAWQPVRVSFGSILQILNVS